MSKDLGGDCGEAREHASFAAHGDAEYEQVGPSIISHVSDTRSASEIDDHNAAKHLLEPELIHQHCPHGPGQTIGDG